MATVDVTRAWKDEEYLAGLSEAERAGLPAHPAGAVELADEQLGAAVGGRIPIGEITDALSCWPTCDATIGGTCPFWSTGCPCGGGGGGTRPV